MCQSITSWQYRDRPDHSASAIYKGAIRNKWYRAVTFASAAIMCTLLASCNNGDATKESGNPPPKAEDTNGKETAAPASKHPIDQTEEGAIYRQAVAALDAGDVKGAVEARDRLQGHPQFHVLAEAVDAIALVKKGEYEQAMRAAEQLSRIPVMQAESFMIAGEIFRAQGKWNQAIAAFRNAIELHPELTRAHRWLGAMFHDVGAMQDATEHLRKVAALDPSDYRSLRLCGLIQYEYQKYDHAVSDYTQALKRSPPEHVEQEIRIELADSLRELRKVDEALEALAKCQDSPEVFAMRAECLETGAKMDEALKAAQRAVELAPEHSKANLVLGRIYNSMRRPKDAIEPLRRAVQADPSNHEPRFLLGRALLQTGNAEEGKQQLEKSTELKNTFLKMAELHVRGIEKPLDATIRVELGALAEEMGRARIALSWYRAALGLDPDNAVAAKSVGRLTAEITVDDDSP